jgi:hypothetical protein
MPDAGKMRNTLIRRWWVFISADKILEGYARFFRAAKKLPGGLTEDRRHQSERPRWDGMCLWYGDRELANYQKKQAPNQTAILDVMQQAGWPSHRVLLPEACWQNLPITLYRINAKIKGRIIQLHAAGDGHSVIWKKNPDV